MFVVTCLRFYLQSNGQSTPASQDPNENICEAESKYHRTKQRLRHETIMASSSFAAFNCSLHSYLQKKIISEYKKL